MTRRNLIFGVLMMALGAFAFFYSGQYDQVTNLGSGSTGGSLFPRIASCGLFLSSLVIFIKALLGKDKSEKAEAINWGNFLITICLLSAYYLLLKPLGFIVSSALAVMFMMYRLGCRNWWVLILYSVVMPAIIFVVFYYFMYVSLPLGILSSIIPKY